MGSEPDHERTRSARELLAIATGRLSSSLERALGRPKVQKALSLLSQLLLLAIFAGYLGVWLSGNWEMLTDPRLQNSDARTSIFPFHRYAQDPNLGDDPIADEMLALVPPGVHFLYRILVPFSDVFVAPKIVQAIALLILIFAGSVLAASKKTGVAAGCLLLFLVLHDWFSVYRVAGGLPRAFGFPLFALWLAGALAQRRWVRWSAPVLCALTYPSVMNLLLAAEGLLTLRQLGRAPPAVTLRRLKRYAALVFVCFLCALPSVVGADDRGPIHTLEQAQAEPAFGKDGRLWILPFADPTEALGDAFIDTLLPKGAPLLPEVAGAYARDPKMSALILLSLVLTLVLIGLSPPPTIALGFLIGAVVLYGLSRALAFQLYSPERYYSFGMRMAAICFLTVVLARAFAHVRGPYRATLQNLLVSGFLLTVWAGAGSGVVRYNGMTIDQRKDRELYEFLSTLPKDVRVASHPMDGDGIPYYSARATMGSFETLQPWFTGSWKKQKDRTEATLTALYAEQSGPILAYAQQHRVTHFLIKKNRYGRNASRGVGSFQPFTDFARALVRGKDGRDLFFSRPPKDAIIYDRGPWRVVEVSRLSPPEPSSPPEPPSAP